MRVLDSESGEVIWSEVELATGLSKLKGIMFKPRQFRPLLFDFGKERRFGNSIHSLFCPEFEAVFLDKDKVVIETHFVAPFKLIVFPSKPFRYLIEIPTHTKALFNGQKLKW